ncbi:WG repeat-containing protein [Parasediminibacterium paludis]|uniref:WG repeat-containing protein n=1 Tax=Parasediminibacterium paludis TaxID=908966 RepID=A0ABV8PZ43_9BACT
MCSKLTILILLFSTQSFGQINKLYQFRSQNNKYGFIDKTGNIKIEPIYLVVKKFSDGLYFVSKEVITRGYKWVCIDTLGNEVFDIQDNFPETDFSEGFARISSLTRQWFINKKGINQFKRTWKDGYQAFTKDIAYVSNIPFSNFYPIDTTGRRIGNKTYSRVEIYQNLKSNSLVFSIDTLVKFKQDSLWGFKNENGDIVIKPKFYFVDRFQNGLCAVRLSYQEFDVVNDYFFDAIINTKGEIVSQQPMHCYMGLQGDFIEYYGGFHFSGGVHYLDKNGQRVIPK